MALADRSVGLDQRHEDADQFVLRSIRTGDMAAVNDIGRTGDLRQSVIA
jgi:hypothetical protein